MNTFIVKKKIILDRIMPLFFLSIPVVSCFLLLCSQGMAMNEVFIPGGPRNDDLFYYKQVEGFIHYGSAQGAFGYNESRAVIGTFGTWSFVVYIPWIIWGKIFG